MKNIRLHKALHQTSLCILLILIFCACEKFDTISSNPNLKLSFSSDSIVFDTVFTSRGSITKKLLIYNSSDDNLNIEEISLGLLNASSYRINVDGLSATALNDVKIRSQDSLYVFVRVLIDPNNQNSPFVIEDEINFLTNGNLQTIKLVSWGQNAHYIIADQEASNGMSYKSIVHANDEVIWDDTKPYLIYGFAKVDSAARLLITEGTQIHFHNNSGLWIDNDAQLKVEGTLENRIVFQGDRLDEDYADITSQWDKIWIENSGMNHHINYAIIKNGTTGLLLTNETESNANIAISNSIIENMSANSISTTNFNIQAYNNLISNAGASLINARGEGNLRFIHSTLVNYWQHSVRNAPSIYIDGELSMNSTVYFGNCILDGNKTNELLVLNESDSGLEYVFDHCSLKTNVSLANESNFINIIQNPSNLFEDLENQIYMLSPTSAAIDQGKLSLGIEFPVDLLNNNRSLAPDLGVFEYSTPSKIK